MNSCLCAFRQHLSCIHICVLSGNTCLQLAAAKGHEQVVQRLVQVKSCSYSESSRLWYLVLRFVLFKYWNEVEIENFMKQTHDIHMYVESKTKVECLNRNATVHSCLHPCSLAEHPYSLAEQFFQSTSAPDYWQSMSVRSWQIFLDSFNPTFVLWGGGGVCSTLYNLSFFLPYHSLFSILMFSCWLCHHYLHCLNTAVQYNAVYMSLFAMSYSILLILT